MLTKILYEREIKLKKCYKYDDIIMSNLDSCTVTLNGFFCKNFSNSDIAIASYSILGIITSFIILYNN